MMRNLTLLLLFAFMALPAQAWPGEGDGPRHHGPRHEGPRHERGSVQMIERHAAEVGVDDATLAEIRAVAQSHRAEDKAIRKQLHDAREALREVLEQPRPDEAEVVSLAAAIGTIETQASTNRLLSMVRTRALLTDEQSEALLELGASRYAGKRAAAEAVREACADDIASTCGDADGSPFQAMHCLRSAEPETLSQSCTDAMQELQRGHKGWRHRMFGRHGGLFGGPDAAPEGAEDN